MDCKECVSAQLQKVAEMSEEGCVDVGALPMTIAYIGPGINDRGWLWRLPLTANLFVDQQ